MDAQASAITTFSNLMSAIDRQVSHSLEIIFLVVSFKSIEQTVESHKQL